MANKLLIAKNSAALYARMLLSLLVSLYTSRIVLEALGVEDFGVYNVVGGIIGFMAFFNSSLSGAISRFITFELGRGNIDKLKDTFSSAFIINTILALAIIVIGETVGLWFLNYKLSIPEDTYYAANWVYQFTIIGMVISVTQIPYTALVIAHEKMAIYAYVELFVVCLRLLMVYLLLVINSNHLIWYSAMVTGINVLMAFIYRLYCIHNFEESRFRFIWRRDILKPILSFSGWEVFGNISLTMRMQGLTVLINMFFGVVLNAANGIASQVNNNILSFSTNIVTAYRPQIIKSYASRNCNDFTNLIIDGAKIALLAMICMVIPLIVEMDYVLKIWLKTPPDMTNILCRLALITSVFGAANYTTNIGIQATGQVKYLNIVNGILNLIILGGVYLALKLGGDVQWVYYVSIVMNLMLLTSSLCILKKVVPYYDSFAFAKTFLKVIIVGVFTFFAARLSQNIMSEGFLRLIVVILVSVIVLSTATILFLLTNEERNKLISILKKLKH